MPNAKQRQQARKAKYAGQYYDGGNGNDYSRKTYNYIAEIADDFDGRKESLRKDWHGVSSKAQIMQLAEHGWQDVEAEAMDIAESVVATVQREHDIPQFESYLDVSGMSVDIGRFIEGESECMTNFTLVPVPSAGNVITLCASICYSGSVTPAEITRRGYGIAALAFALHRIGYAVELWADISIDRGNQGNRTRILVKGPNDEMDVSRIMFAYAHPGMFRGLGFGCPNFHHGMPIDPEEDLPEGTIYLPAVWTGSGIVPPYSMVVNALTDLGIIDS